MYINHKVLKNMTIEFRNRDSEYIKQWPNWDGVIPMIGDTVVLHFGYDNETEEYYNVEGREISGTDSDKIVLYIEKLD